MAYNTPSEREIKEALQLLALGPECTLEEALFARNHLQKFYHTDHSHADTTSKSQEVNAAYDTVKLWIKSGRATRADRSEKSEETAKGQQESSRASRNESSGAEKEDSRARSNARHDRQSETARTRKTRETPSFWRKAGRLLLILIATALWDDNTFLKLLARAAVATLIAVPVYIYCHAAGLLPHQLRIDLFKKPPIWLKRTTYKKGIYTYYDYELRRPKRKAPKGLRPPMPKFEMRDLPIMARVPSQENSGSLKRFEIAIAAHRHFAGWLTAFNMHGQEYKEIVRDIRFVSEEQAVLLICTYVHRRKGLVRDRMYWLRDFPDYIRKSESWVHRPDLRRKHPLLRVGKPRKSCPRQISL